MTTIYEAYKKRSRNPKLYGLHTFGDPGYPLILSGPFRDNIRLFLRESAEIEDYNFQGMPIWCTLLLNEKNGVVIPLYTIEESVKHSLRPPFCDHCRCIGWSHHFVSKRRYHIIIPMEDKWNKPLEASALDVQTHILHGLIHCNGFGHILCINGIEGGSKFLHGTEIMNLWDRICTALRTRKITVEDTSRKRSMDFRLLHGVAYGCPWFGRWGYKFCHGSFGVNEHKYEAAIGILRSLQLTKVIEDFSSNGRHIKQIVGLYRQMSDTHLTTLGDLFRFMLSLKSKAPVQRKSIMAAAATPLPKAPTKVIRQRKSPIKEKPIKFTAFVTEMASRWPARRLEYAAEVIVDALKEKRGGMSRQEVRDAARLHIGDTGLLDFVIKSINNYIVGNYVVRRSINPTTKVLQFTIHEVASADQLESSNTITDPSLDIIAPGEVFSDPSGMNVYRDIEYLYQKVLEDYPESELVELATQIVLDCKHFVKEWPFKDEDDDLLRFMCQIVPSSEELGTELTRTLPPGELVVLPPHVTIGELKVAAETAFRDTYCVTENYLVREVEGVNGMDDNEVVFGTMESGVDIRVRGSGIDVDSKLRYEGGIDNWTVDCSCGAKDDDGERMVACDICEVWQHTRCGGIGDSETVPPLFLCARCSSSLMPAALTDYGMMNMDYE